MSDLKYWLGFNYVNGIGPAKVQALLGHFGTLAAAWSASEGDVYKRQVRKAQYACPDGSLTGVV